MIGTDFPQEQRRAALALVEPDPNAAATIVQKTFRSYRERAKTQKMVRARRP